MNQIFTVIHPFIIDLLQIIVGLVLTVAGLGAKYVWKWFQSHTNVNNRKFLESLAKEAYAYVENWYAGQGGKVKLAEAVNRVLKKINLQKIGITREDVVDVIQKAWQDYNPGKTPTIIEAAAPAAPSIPDHVQKLLDAVKEFNVVQSSQTDSQPAAAPADPQATPYQPTPVTTQQ